MPKMSERLSADESKAIADRVELNKRLEGHAPELLEVVKLGVEMVKAQRDFFHYQCMTNRALKIASEIKFDQASAAILKKIGEIK